MSCDFCEIRKYNPFIYGETNINVFLGTSNWAGCYIGIAAPNPHDKMNHIAIWGEGEYRTEYYYPKYCPECGREIIENREVRNENG